MPTITRNLEDYLGYYILLGANLCHLISPVEINKYNYSKKYNIENIF